MEEHILSPQERLPQKAVAALRISSLISHGITVLILAVLFGLQGYFSFGSWARYVLYGLLFLTAVSAVWSVGLRPVFLVRHFRYGISSDYLSIKSGAFHETHEIVPMTKIQSVSTNQGPVLRRFGFYSLAAETVASVHGIPALPKETAMAVRSEIARYARIKEVDD